MEHNLTANLSLLNSTLSKEGIFDDREEPQTVINSNFTVRNMVVGSTGILVNSLAFLLVYKTKKVNQGRKLLLLNLIASDIISMICMSVYGADESTRTSGGKGCMPLVFFLILTIISSYVTALQISVLNFLAVYKPFRFQRLATWKKSGIAVLLGWLFNTGMCIWCIGVQFPDGFTCAPIVNIPRSGLVGISTITMVSFIGVMVLNLGVVIKLRTNDIKIRQPNKSLQRTRQQHKKSMSNFTQLFGRCRKIKVHPASSGNVNLSHPQTTTSEPIHTDDVRPSHFLTPKNKARPCESVSRAIQPAVHIQINHQPVEQTSHSKYSAGKINTSSSSNDENVPSALNSSKSIDRICKTFLILTTYSCLLSLPIVVYLICIATYVIEDPEKMVVTPLGIFVSSCPILKACINPFFYAFSFVKWQNLIDWIKRRG